MTRVRCTTLVACLLVAAVGLAEVLLAELAGQGMSNKDIAAQYWVSPRTVAFHLRNIFTKAGVTSRGELAHLDLS